MKALEAPKAEPQRFMEAVAADLRLPLRFITGEGVTQEQRREFLRFLRPRKVYSSFPVEQRP